MGVVPGDPRALTEIESHLAKSDPALAAKFAAFATDPPRAREPERQPPAWGRAPARARHGRARQVAVLLVLALMLAMCLTMVALTAP